MLLLFKGVPDYRALTNPLPDPKAGLHAARRVVVQRPAEANSKKGCGSAYHLREMTKGPKIVESNRFFSGYKAADVSSLQKSFQMCAI